MPRSTEDIIKQADEMAKRFEDAAPGLSNLKDATSLRRIRQLFLQRAETERELVEAVAAARIDGQSWSAIGAMLGTSGEAARQKFGSVVAHG